MAKSLVHVDGLTPASSRKRCLSFKRERYWVTVSVYSPKNKDGGWAIRVKPEELRDKLREFGLL